MIDADRLAKELLDFLPRQRWFASSEVSEVTIARCDQLDARLLHVMADVATGRYQLICGLSSDGELVLDALADAELAIQLLRHIAPDERATEARLMGVEQTNSSVVFDERLFLKLFRRIPAGPNPDAEVTRRLAETGFDGVVAPLAEWRKDDEDYAVVTPFLAGGQEGWDLAVDSAASAGQREFIGAARDLGALTARLHLAMAEAFGKSPAEPGRWAEDMEAQLERVDHPDLDRDAIRAVYRRLASLDDAGAAVRVHGDYHLGQVMRVADRWYVLDFEGEPARPLEERRRPSSPLRDVAGLVRSFDYAAHVGGGTAKWLAECAAAFGDAYRAQPGIARLLPADPGPVAAAFELDKAVYEVGYELAHRPDWVGIPLDAVNRILERVER